MTNPAQPPRTLALYVTRRGIAFALFTAPLEPQDWGTKDVCGADMHANGLRAVRQLMERYRPDVVVIEDANERSSRRFPRIRAMYRTIARYAEHEGIVLKSYSRTAIREAFSPVAASTKYEIDCAIVRMIPALRARQPHKRRAWDSESAAQGLFDAVSLGITFFANTGGLDIERAAGEGKSPSSLFCERKQYVLRSRGCK
jgi:Holliday junction resolvasome RuvABC endonuclease subunit